MPFRSSVAYETAPNNTRTPMKGFFRLFSRSIGHGVLRSWATAFRPWAARRSRTSSSVRPARRVCNCSISAEAVRSAASRRTAVSAFSCRAARRGRGAARERERADEGQTDFGQVHGSSPGVSESSTRLTGRGVRRQRSKTNGGECEPGRVLHDVRGRRGGRPAERRGRTTRRLPRVGCYSEVDRLGFA